LLRRSLQFNAGSGEQYDSHFRCLLDTIIEDVENKNYIITSGRPAGEIRPQFITFLVSLLSFDKMRRQLTLEQRIYIDNPRSSCQSKCVYSVRNSSRTGGRQGELREEETALLKDLPSGKITMDIYIYIYIYQCSMSRHNVSRREY
ncbi:hypothetical protein L9F63_021528, partial [Diploptera punctata]